MEFQRKRCGGFVHTHIKNSRITIRHLNSDIINLYCRKMMMDIMLTYSRDRGDRLPFKRLFTLAFSRHILEDTVYVMGWPGLKPRL